MKKLLHFASEAGFIVFLFYSNLLMGEFDHMGQGQTNGLSWALWDIFTVRNFIIAVLASTTGIVLFESIRSSLQKPRD